MFLINLIFKFVYEGEIFEIPISEIPRLFLEGHFSNSHLETKKEEISSRSREKKKRKKVVVYPCISRKDDSLIVCSMFQAQYYEANDMYYFNPNVKFEEGSLEYELFIMLNPKIREAIVSSSSMQDVDSLNRFVMSGKSEEEIQQANKMFYDMQLNEIQLTFLQYQLGLDGFTNFIEEGQVMKDQVAYETRAEQMINERLKQLANEMPMSVLIPCIPKDEIMEEEDDSEGSDETEIEVREQDSTTVEERMEVEEMKTVQNMDNQGKIEIPNIQEWINKTNYIVGNVLSDMKRKLWKTRKRKKRTLENNRINVMMVMMILMCLESREIRYWKKQRIKKDEPPGGYCGMVIQTIDRGRGIVLFLKFELFVKRQNTEFKNAGEVRQYLIEHVFEIRWIIPSRPDL